MRKMFVVIASVFVSMSVLVNVTAVPSITSKPVIDRIDEVGTLKSLNVISLITWLISSIITRLSLGVTKALGVLIGGTFINIVTAFRNIGTGGLILLPFLEILTILRGIIIFIFPYQNF